MTDTKILGDYKIIKSIGQGALGIVYLAEHRFMKRQVALKVLPEELSQERSFVQRFEEEVGLLAGLDHENIVKVHNISFAQGHHFLVTDCVVDENGETTNLAQYLRARHKQIKEEEIYHILAQIADALDYAHSRKGVGTCLAHRGLKLNNILISKGKAGINIHLSDFGLSKIIGPGAILARSYKVLAEALGIASSGGIAQEGYPVPPLDIKKLTPLHASFLQNYFFLAPEQKQLEECKIGDAKADIYAFGILAYFLLCGCYPEGFFEMPSALLPGYQYDWDTLISQCLQVNPEKRPANLLSLLESCKNERKAQKKVEVDSFIEAVQAEKEEMSCAEPQLSVAEMIEPLPPVELPAEPVEDISKKSLRPILNVAQLERPKTDLDPGIIFQLDTTVKQYLPEKKEIENIQPLMTDMVSIPGGVFARGSASGNRDEMPRHQVTVDSFAMDIHPVTNEQFARFLEVMGGEKDTNHHDIIRLRDSRIKRSGGKVHIEFGYNRHPVVGVTWYGALAYAKWVGKRLPTEVEWEVAAYGGFSNYLFPTGDDIEKNQANFFSADTTAVMSYAPNGYGLYDMAGNVYEWCHDWYGYNYYEISVQEPENPKGPLQGVYRVLRGGCWKSLKEDLRCSRRHRNNPGTVNGTYGFRCAADAQ
ncbi:bifunctional serine/threonine-protein kinase/formylglycine-generating enzyme family protein [Parachlamydia sp. AcF125]|uniref:bifunctional serine/threonine-protein kinase/formylglycine-generating enzyme family protein n=1 Tax=Parachlamydia sp. AcF125 TaxID=2795736 RepID=UPI001BC9AA7D|nr:bifunctional serine/threonine-protein kinase/formylglycine-generating enzyme family protein [Parachlamydia sp. AcF125]MBS4168567.1 Serine/threonine-protein kinase pkn1 [Parachlamydia sp. AcF125]